MSRYAPGAVFARWPRSISTCGCLGKRPDGYHELRTIFQTISLADTLDIALHAGREDRHRTRRRLSAFRITW